MGFIPLQLNGRAAYNEILVQIQVGERSSLAYGLMVKRLATVAMLVRIQSGEPSLVAAGKNCTQSNYCDSWRNTATRLDLIKQKKNNCILLCDKYGVAQFWYHIRGEGYYVGTVGDMSEDVVRKYIDSQHVRG